MSLSILFFNATATTEIYTYLHTLSLHDALPILTSVGLLQGNRHVAPFAVVFPAQAAPARGGAARCRLSDHFIVGLPRCQYLGTGPHAQDAEIGRAHV